MIDVKHIAHWFYEIEISVPPSDSVGTGQHLLLKLIELNFVNNVLQPCVSMQQLQNYSLNYDNLN